jgi:rSAM/selenodomain-associated transferase 1
MAEARRRVVVFLRAPRLGRVKTRLAREIGAAAALGFYRRTALATVRRLAADPTFETVLALVPEPGRLPDPWPRGLGRIVQRGHDLGARMAHALAAVGPGPVLVVGSDIPGLEARHVRRAFRLLGEADAVIGPAADGGYWLVGFRRRPLPRGAFRDVRWSGPHARADTLGNLDGLRVAMADLLSDVDDAEAFAQLDMQLRRRAGARAP